MSDKKRFLIAAGGTGGHLFPAMAVVEQLELLYGKDIECIFAGTNRIESEIIPSKGYEFHKMDIYGITKKLSLKTFMLPFKLFMAVNKMRKLIKSKKIDAVIATGAYISYPPGVAAFKENIPLFLMESNVNPGKSINLLREKASYIFTSFQESEKYFPQHLKKKLIYIGNPVRKDLLNPMDKQKAKKLFGMDENKKTLLVFGGSLGARSINNAVLNLIKDDRAQDIQILWQTGKNFPIPKNLPKNVTVATFIHDMATAYSASDFVISRSGATTISELEIVGKPAFLVPLPSASNNEQAKNAEILQQKEASILISDIEIENRITEIFNIIHDDQLLEKMSKNLLNLAKPSAAEETAKFIMSHLGK